MAGVHLSRTDENVAEIEALASLLGGRVGLDGVLADLGSQARPSRLGRLLGRAVGEAYTWEDRDARDLRWWPQGISTSADASESEVVGGRRLLALTWYSRQVGGVSHGSRVTILDLDTLRYRHVLLVVPILDDQGGLRLEPLHVHAGGLVWCGPYLHVAATSRGFVTCRLDDVLPAAGRVESHGHDYVLPVRFSYRAHAEEGQHKLRYSFLSLDRAAAPTLVVGEYGRGSDTTRLVRFGVDAESALLLAGDDGLSRPLALDDGGVVQMQGAVIARGRYYVTTSHGQWRPGSVYAGQPGSFTPYRLAVPMGPDDLAYWPSTDRLWSVSEHPRRRWIFSMRRAWFD
ncbi:MAG: hypothetical protein ACXWDL_07155 [Nocardioides sp.]